MSSEQWEEPPDGFATPHFHWRREIACRHCGRVPSLEAALKTAQWMEKVREALGGRVLHVNSWCRCTAHNDAIGGAKASLHTRGLAVDLTARDMSPREVQRACRPLQEQGLIGGLGSYKSFTHVDRGPRRNWNGP